MSDNTCLWDSVVRRPLVAIDDVPKPVVSAFPFLFYGGGTHTQPPATSTLPERAGGSRTSYHNGTAGARCIYCTSLGVEVFLDKCEGGGVRDRASMVVVVVTRSHIIIGCLDTKTLVHVVPLVGTDPLSITTERIRVPLFADGDSMGGSVYDGGESLASGRSRRGKGSMYGGQSIQTAPAVGERYLSSMALQYTHNHTPCTALLQFPAAVDFDNIVASLRAVATHLGRTVAWSDVSTEEEAAGGQGEDEDVLKASEGAEQAIPGTLRRAVVLMPRTVCQPPPPTAVIPWVSLDRVVAYLGAPPGTSTSTALTRSAGRSRGLQKQRRNAAADSTPDPLQQAQQQLVEVEAEVRRGLQSLRRDLCSSLQYLRDDITRHGVEARLHSVLALAAEEERKEKGVIKPLEAELDDVTKLLILRRRELDDAQGSAHQELSQWAQLDSDCRRIELQRLQAAAETKESNAAMLQRLTADNKQMQSQVDQLRSSIEALSGPAYMQLVNEADDLQASINAEVRAQKVLANEQGALLAKVGRLAGEEQATLAALQRIRDTLGSTITSLRTQLDAAERSVNSLEGGTLAESQQVLSALEARMHAAKSTESDLAMSIGALEERRRALLMRVDEENRSSSTGPASPISPSYPGRPTAFITRRPRVGESDALSPFGRSVDRWGSNLSRSGPRRQAPSVSGSPHVVPTHSLTSLSPSTSRQFYVERSRADEAAAYRDATEMDAQTRLQHRLRTVRDDLSKSFGRR